MNPLLTATVLSLSLAASLLAGSALAQSAASAPAAKPAEMLTPAAEPKAATATGDTLSGKAAWYGRKFNGRKTASGQRFNASAMTAAHPALAFGSRVKVTNTKNQRSVVVVINDRGPSTPGRIIDVSQAAATRLGFERAGTADVKLEVVGAAKARRAKK